MIVCIHAVRFLSGADFHGFRPSRGNLDRCAPRFMRSFGAVVHNNSTKTKHSQYCMACVCRDRLYSIGKTSKMRRLYHVNWLHMIRIFTLLT